MAETATQLTFTLNGESIATPSAATTTLLQYLQQIGRTGTKQGCGDGDCGACTVAIVGTDANGKPNYQAVNSCLIPLGSVAGRAIVTVEGLAGEQLHPVQAAMVETGGSQCGYCTPGFIMSLFAAYYSGQVDDASVEGNLCRCTGYLSIRQAAAQVNNAQPNDEFERQLQAVNCVPTALQYRDRFYRPTHLAEAIALLQEHPDATLMAGATDLCLDMSHDRRRFAKLISLEALPELLTIDRSGLAVEIGAAVPLTQIEMALHGEFPALDAMLHLFAARQIRNRATLGGNIGTASPIGDLPPILLALDADLRIAGQTGERTLPIAQFFQGYRQTDLQPGELIVSVKIPRSIHPSAVRRLSQSYKVGKRGTDDISTVAAAFAIDLDADDRIVQARLAYGGVAATPVRAIAIEQQLIDRTWSLETIQQIKPLLRETFAPLTDLRGSAAYRKLLIANLFEKFFVETLQSQ